VWLTAILLTVVATVACSTGPAPPAKGTPPFYWQAANENFAAGDYEKTTEHLEQLVRSDNEFAAKAFPWQLIMLTGIAEAYMDIGDNAEYGARANTSNPGQFRRQVSDFRSLAARKALNLAETFEKFKKRPAEQNVIYAFPQPKGSPLPVSQLTKLARGSMLTPGEMTTAQKASLERGILLAATRCAGARDDAAKLREILKSGTAEVPRNTFMMGMAESLYKISDLFGPLKLDLPDRRAFFIRQAADAAKGVPETKESKELLKKIDADTKKLKLKS
jgi:hypothetical protein